MKRPRGRRTALLLAAVLPLLVEHGGGRGGGGGAVAAAEHGPDGCCCRSAGPSSAVPPGGVCRRVSPATNNEANASPASMWYDCDAWETTTTVLPLQPPWSWDGGGGCDTWAAPRENATDGVKAGNASVTDGTGPTPTATPNATAAGAASAARGTAAPPSPAASSLMDAVDYASKAAGALILEASPGLDGAANLLTKDRDKYAIADCQLLRRPEEAASGGSDGSSSSADGTVDADGSAAAAAVDGAGGGPEPHYFVAIGLSEDILVKRIVLANYERYSSPFRDFAVLGSTKPDGNWTHMLGNFEMQFQQGKQAFDLAQPVWARYLRFEFKSYHGDEHYCTLSQIMVHGSTVLQGFHEEWESESEAEQNSDRTDAAASDAAAADAGSGAAEAVDTASITPLLPDLVSPNGSDPHMEWGVLSSASICLSNCQFAQATAQAVDMRTNASTSTAASLHQLDDFEVRGGARLVADPDDGRLKLRQLSESNLMERLDGRMKTAGLEATDVDGLRVDIRNKSRSLTASRASAKPEESIPPSSRIGSVHSEADTIEDSSSEGSAPSADVPQTMESLQKTNLVLASFLERYPSAECLQKLDLSSFKARHLKPRSGGAGPEASGASGVEPIFKKLKDEIRALQALVAVQDQYTAASAACYQRVLVDLFLDMEAARREQDRRLDRLEHEYGFALRVATLVRELLSLTLSYLGPLLLLCVDVLAIRTYGPFVSFLRLTCTCSGLVFLGLHILLKVRGKSPPRKGTARPTSADIKTCPYASDESSLQSETVGSEKPAGPYPPYILSDSLHRDDGSPDDNGKPDASVRA